MIHYQQHQRCAARFALLKELLAGSDGGWVALHIQAVCSFSFAGARFENADLPYMCWQRRSNAPIICLTTCKPTPSWSEPMVQQGHLARCHAQGTVQKIACTIRAHSWHSRRSLTSSKNMLAMWWYRGDLNAKSTLNDSQVVEGRGPGLNSQVESRWSNSVLSYTCDTTFPGGDRCTWDVYLRRQ